MKLMDELTPPKRLKIKEGDVFAYRIRGAYRYIRVMTYPMPWDVYRGFAIVYFYQAVSAVADEIPALDKQDLIIGPLIFHPSAFNFGEYKKVDSRSVDAADRRQHCFLREGKDPKHAKELMFFDEAGNVVLDCEQPYESLSIPSSGAIELKLGKALNLVNSREEWTDLPYLPQPLFRASRTGKGPSRLVSMIIPDFVGTDFVNWRSKLDSVQHELLNLPGFKAVAGAEPYKWNELTDHGAGIITFAVKKKQHAEFYRLVAEGMRHLAIERYWMRDDELGDWLAGSFKPEHNPYAI